MENPLWSTDFPICPICKSKDIVSQTAFEVAMGKKPTIFTSLMHEATLLIESTTGLLTLLTVPVLFAHYDVCTSCGTKRCTRVEIRKMPANQFLNQMQGQMPKGPTGFPSQRK